MSKSVCRREGDWDKLHEATARGAGSDGSGMNDQFAPRICDEIGSEYIVVFGAASGTGGRPYVV